MVCGGSSWLLLGLFGFWWFLADLSGYLWFLVDVGVSWWSFGNLRQSSAFFKIAFFFENGLILLQMD